MGNDFTTYDTAKEISGRVLVVDDERITRTLHRTALAKQFDVETANSGDEALRICREKLPDLVLLDMMMPDMDGFETCRKLREFTDIPIIFATANELEQDQLQAFDAGGNDIISKPVVKDILLRKVSLAIQQRQETHNLKSEKDTLQSMAMNFLSAVGESGVLQHFMKASLNCSTPEALGAQLIAAIKLFGLECTVLIRNGQTSTLLSSQGEAGEVEQTILQQSASMGRIFQFKQKMVVNYDRVSLIIENMPTEETESTGRLRDNITMLAEMTDTLCDNVAMRQTSHERAEQFQVALTTNYYAVETLREMNRTLQADTRILLQELVDNTEKTFTWLGTSAQQEDQLSKNMFVSVNKILDLLEVAHIQSEGKFDAVLDSLRQNDDNGGIDLF
ncbi:MAG: response regulator [Gallionella sp.]|nr:response regulator [Gallionella sp.]MDD4945628.1 response regulator [Gallionella sp.]MDD5612465.1 response regulator [Gallionella sp.]